MQGNDYLAKPFYPEELLARIRERLGDGLPEEAGEALYRMGKTTFDYRTNELRYGNRKTLLTSRQAEILQLLACGGGRVVSRETILRAVWGDVSYANSLALNVQITYLRRALAPDTSLQIASLPKKGYVLRSL